MLNFPLSHDLLLVQIVHDQFWVEMAIASVIQVTSVCDRRHTPKKGIGRGPETTEIESLGRSQRCRVQKCSPWASGAIWRDLTYYASLLSYAGINSVLLPLNPVASAPIQEGRTSIHPPSTGGIFQPAGAYRARLTGSPSQPRNKTVRDVQDRRCRVFRLIERKPAEERKSVWTLLLSDAKIIARKAGRFSMHCRITL